MGRRRSGRTTNVEDKTLSQIAKEAEERLAQKRADRVEARNIRMKELEKQQNEAEERQDWNDKASKENVISRNSNASSSSVANSHPTTIALSGEDFKNTVAQLEEKYRLAMVQAAQFDNERSQLAYQTQRLSDLLEELEDELHRLNAEHKTTCQVLEKRTFAFESSQKRCSQLEEALRQRDELIQEQALIMAGETVQDGAAKERVYTNDDCDGSGTAPVNQKDADAVDSASDDPLDSKLQDLSNEKDALLEQVERLQSDLEEERKKAYINDNSEQADDQVAILETRLVEVQREASKEVDEYKLRLHQCEQENASFQGNIARLEEQLQRVKETSEKRAKHEDEMKVEKRKFARDLRQAHDRIEEMEMTIAHLEKRLDHLRTPRPMLGQT